MYNPIEVSQAASKAAEMLGKSGAAGCVRIDKKVILPKETFETNPFPEVEGVYLFELENPLDINANDRLTVNWNDTLYSCNVLGMNGATAFGNIAILGGDDTGEPFLYALSADDVGNVIGAMIFTTQEGTVTLSITQETETIHPIDPKFLPGVCLPVVEITSAAYPESGSLAVSAEESAHLEAAYQTRMPAVIKLTVSSDGAPVVCVFNLVPGELFGIYFANVTGEDVFLFRISENDWYMRQAPEGT